MKRALIKPVLATSRLAGQQDPNTSRPVSRDRDTGSGGETVIASCDSQRWDRPEKKEQKHTKRHYQNLSCLSSSEEHRRC